MDTSVSTDSASESTSPRRSQRSSSTETASPEPTSQLIDELNQKIKILSREVLKWKTKYEMVMKKNEAYRSKLNREMKYKPTTTFITNSNNSLI